MAKKIRTITEEERIEPTQEPGQENEPIVTTIEPQDEDLRAFLDQYGEESPQIKVYKFNPVGKPVFVSDASMDKATESWIQENWGEGQYRIWLLDQNGKYLASKRLWIGPPAAGMEKKNPEPVEPVAVAAGMDGMIQTQIEMIRQQMSLDRELMKTLIEKVADGRGGNDLVELARALAMVKEMATPPPVQTPASMITELVGILKTGIEIGASGGGEKQGWMGTVKEIASCIPEVLRSLPAAARGIGQVEASAPVPPPDPQAQLKAMLHQGIQFLKARAQKGSDPNLYVDMAMDNIDQPQWAGLIGLVEKPFEEIANMLDPELLNPFYRPWFESLFNGIKDAIHDRTASSGAGDDNANPRQDGEFDA